MKKHLTQIKDIKKKEEFEKEFMSFKVFFLNIYNIKQEKDINIKETYDKLINEQGIPETWFDSINIMEN